LILNRKLKIVCTDDYNKARKLRGRQEKSTGKQRN